MNFLSMDYFVMVAKERSFTRAAQRLYITQQTLSAHIAALEEEVGSQLFIRHVPLELTHSGQVFLRYASEFQRKLNDMEQEMGDLTGNQRGLLRIGIASTRGRAIMPTLIDGFQEQYPHIAVHLTETTNEKLRQSLLDREIDLAIANFPEVVPGVELADFYQEEIVLLVSHSLLERCCPGIGQEAIQKAVQGDLSALRSCPFLMNGPQDISGKFGRELLARSGVIPEAKVESSNVETLLDLCARGAGACFCPENLVNTALTPEQAAALEIVRFGEDTRYMIRFGYLKQAYHWSVISNFIDMARQLIPNQQ